MDDATYQARYPHYCRQCRGLGIVKDRAAAQGVTDCTCLAQQRCPRCMETLTKLRNCYSCGWDIDDPQRGLPSAHAA